MEKKPAFNNWAPYSWFFLRQSLPFKRWTHQAYQYKNPLETAESNTKISKMKKITRNQHKTNVVISSFRFL